MQNNSKIINSVSRQPLWRKAAVILILAAAAYWWFGRDPTVTSSATFAARRGPLDITVLQGGSTEALESQDIKSEVRGYQGTKILKIVEEGYQVTEDDVKNGKVLVELDSSELQKLITQQDIQFQSTLATLKEAEQAYDIQLNQNLSDVKAAEQKAKFAHMDFEKFLGDSAVADIISQLDLPSEEEATPPANPAHLTPASELPPAAANGPSSHGPPAGSLTVEDPKSVEVKLAGGGSAPVKIVPHLPATGPSLVLTNQESEVSRRIREANAAAPPKKINIDFSRYSQLEALGDGEAKQKIRKFQDDLQVADKEMKLATNKLAGTRRLYDKGFVTKTEMDSDEILFSNARLKHQTAQTAQNLFLKYEFPKSAEEVMSKYVEAMRELDRARKGAISKLAQAEARLKSSEGRYNLEVRQRKDLYDQLDKCVIKAKKTGLVVYGGRSRYEYYPQDQIREGALIREHQPIITIPDMTKMAVKVRIHESHIKKVKKGLKVRITLDAFPDKTLDGEVIKVGVLPDSQNQWMNPDMKVYLTTIDIVGVHEWLKPGMSSKVVIQVKRLADVVYVPVQAVNPVEGKHICYVAKAGGRQERREVEIGENNDEFIEITKGIREGEKVCLRSPDGTDQEGGDKNQTGTPEKTPEEKPAPSPATPAAKPKIAAKS